MTRQFGPEKRKVKSSRVRFSSQLLNVINLATSFQFVMVSIRHVCCAVFTLVLFEASLCETSPLAREKPNSLRSLLTWRKQQRNERRKRETDFINVAKFIPGFNVQNPGLPQIGGLDTNLIVQFLSQLVASGALQNLFASSQNLFNGNALNPAAPNLLSQLFAPSPGSIQSSDNLPVRQFSSANPFAPRERIATDNSLVHGNLGRNGLFDLIESAAVAAAPVLFGNPGHKDNLALNPQISGPLQPVPPVNPFSPFSGNSVLSDSAGRQFDQLKLKPPQQWDLVRQIQTVLGQVQKPK